MTVRTADAYPASDDEIPSLVAELGLEGLVDLHVHAMPDALQRAVWGYFDRLDDPPWPIHYRAQADARLDHLAEVGVVAHTALAYAHKPGMLPWLNGYTLDLAERRPGVIPTFTIFPDDDLDEQVETSLRRGGKVVKVHTQVGRFHLTDPRLSWAWSQIQRRGVVVMAHVTAVYGVDGGAEFCGIDRLARLLEDHPDLVVVIAHLGIPEIDEALALAEQADRVLLDPSMALYDAPALRPHFTHRQIERLANLADQLVYGSDYPSIPHDLAAQVRGLATLELTDDQLRRVLAETAKRHLPD